MLKLIAILILSGQLHVAVEQGTGYAEMSFANSSDGAKQLMDFAERSVGEAPDGVRIVVGWVDDADSEEHILQALSHLGIGNGLISPADIRSAVAEHQLSGPSALAVALADEKRFGFLYRRKK